MVDHQDGPLEVVDHQERPSEAAGHRKLEASVRNREEACLLVAIHPRHTDSDFATIGRRDANAGRHRHHYNLTS